MTELDYCNCLAFAQSSSLVVILFLVLSSVRLGLWHIVFPVAELEPSRISSSDASENPLDNSLSGWEVREACATGTAI